MNKQIEEMGFIIQENSPLSKISSQDVAESLYNAGYRKQSDWISVDERLPERNGRYLVHCDLKIDNLVCILCYNKVDGFDETVTHWMPLPEVPPKKETKESK